MSAHEQRRTLLTIARKDFIVFFRETALADTGEKANRRLCDATLVPWLSEKKDPALGPAGLRQFAFG
jgi:hypothetical protein